MNPASLNDLKKALDALPEKTVREYCLKLARYKKENKELLSFIVFMADDIPGYVRDIRTETDALFEALNTQSTYLSTKGLRKILRTLTKYIRFAGEKSVEADLLIYFCSKMKKLPIRIASSTALLNLYNRQVEKIYRAVENLHEDIQFDYRKDLENILL